MNAPLTPGPIRTTAPPALWRVARAFMHMLHTLFGAPEDVAASHTLHFAAYKLMTSWLRAGEAMMRRLLIIEAAAYAKPNTRPLLRTPRKRTRKPMRFAADAPQQWRVSFRCFTNARALRPLKDGATHAQTAKPRRIILRDDRPAPRPQVRRRRRNRKHHAPMLRQDRECIVYKESQVLHSAWPLAERYEALLRVFNNPLPYARRLSRRLHATLHRLHELYRAPPEAADRVDNFSDFTEAAARSWDTS